MDIGGHTGEYSGNVKSMECDRKVRRTALSRYYEDMKIGILKLHRGHMAQSIFGDI